MVCQPVPTPHLYSLHTLRLHPVTTAAQGAAAARLLEVRTVLLELYCAYKLLGPSLEDGLIPQVGVRAENLFLTSLDCRSEAHTVPDKAVASRDGGQSPPSSRDPVLEIPIRPPQP